MMKRNRKSVEIAWFHLDAIHPSYPATITALKKIHDKSGATLSVNLRHDGTRALVKLMGTSPIMPSGVVIKKYTETDHDAAVAMVNTFATTVDKSVGWQPPL